MRKFFILILAVYFTESAPAQQQKGFSVSTPSQNSSSGKTYALIVGISKYQNPNIPQLQFADRDAIAFRNYLVASGVDSNKIILLVNENATGFNIKYDFDDLCTNKVQEGDKVFFYFSGHGDVEARTVARTGYLLPYDATDKVYSINGIEVKFLQDYSATLSSKGVKPILIVDACHSGKLAGGMDGMSYTASLFADKWKDETKILSCQPGEFSLENKSWGNGRGLFSYELISGMAGLADKNHDGKVSLYELNLYLEEKVHEEASPVPQNPMLIGDMEEIVSTTNNNLMKSISTNNDALAFAPIDMKGSEEGLLRELPDSIVKLYNLFIVALDSGKYIDLKDSTKPSAYYYFKRIPSNDSTKLLLALMKRNFAAGIVAEVETEVQSYLHDREESYKFSNSGVGGSGGDDKYPFLLEELLGQDKIDELRLQPKLLFLQALGHGADLAVVKYKNGSFGIALQYGSKPGLKFLDSVMAVDPQAAYAIRLRADIHYQHKEYSSALGESMQANQLCPKFLLPIKTIIHSYEKLNKYDSAIVWLRKFVAIDSTNSMDVYSEFGKCFFKIGKIDSSDYYFDRSFLNRSSLQTESQKKVKKLRILSNYCFEQGDYQNTIRFSQEEFLYDDSAIYNTYYTLALSFSKVCEIDSSLKYIEWGLKNKKYLQREELKKIDCLNSNVTFKKLLDQYPVKKQKKNPNSEFHNLMKEMEKEYPDIFFDEE